VSVAIWAAKGKIVRFRRAAVFDAFDVVNLKIDEGTNIGQEAIFTSESG